MEYIHRVCVLPAHLLCVCFIFFVCFFTACIYLCCCVHGCLNPELPVWPWPDFSFGFNPRGRWTVTLVPSHSRSPSQKKKKRKKWMKSGQSQHLFWLWSPLLFLDLLGVKQRELGLWPTHPLSATLLIQGSLASSAVFYCCLFHFLLWETAVWR